MSKALLNDVLLQSVGKPVMSKKGKVVGNIIEATRNPRSRYIEYLVLKCAHKGSDDERFFAVPASSRFITISDAFTIYFQYPKEDIFLAQESETEKCLLPDLTYGKTIFELTDYEPPGNRKINYLSLQGGGENQQPDSSISPSNDGQSNEKKYQDEQEGDNDPRLKPVM